MIKTNVIYLFFFALCTLNCVAQNFQWAAGLGGNSYEDEGGVHVDVNGNVYSTGSFSNIADFDPGPGTFSLASNGAGDIYITKLDRDGNFVWAKSVGGAKGDGGNAIKVDNSGNIFTTGIFDSIVDFDPGPGTYTLDAYGSNKAFILKLDGSGNFVWAKCLEGSNTSSYGTDLVLDNFGNVLSVGVFSGISDFDPTLGVFNMGAPGKGQTYILKLNTFGNFVFAKNFSGNFSIGINSICLDAAGNIFTTGEFNATIDFDPGTGISNLSSQGDFDVFISKLDINGNFVWAKKIGGVWEDSGHSLKIDQSGNIYISGEYQDVVDFDPGPGTFTMSSVSTGFPNANDIFILKMDNNGTFIYSKSIGSAGEDIGYSIVIDSFGNTYTSGTFMNTPDFDPGPGTYTISAVGLKNGYVVKLDASGNFDWAYSLLANSYDIAVDNYFFYVSGDFGGTQDFDPGSGVYNLTSHGFGDVFIQKLSLSCNATTPLSIVSTSSLLCASETATLSVSGANTYTWSTGSNSSGIVITPSSTTSYTVDGATPNGCVLNSVFTQSVSACIGIEEFAFEKIKIYPNPVSDRLNFESNQTFVNSVVEIFDYLGQNVLQLEFSNSIDVSELASGVYMIKIINEDRSYYTKFVKE